MPEGHMIHHLADEQSSLLCGTPVLAESPQGRFREEAAVISGRVLKQITAHGKHIFYHFSANKIVHVHLGLYGKYRSFRNPPDPPRGAVRLRLIGRDSGFDLNGPNQCELIDQPQMQRLLDRLGQDPLRHDANPSRVWERIQRSNAPIGGLLLDQSVVAGIGNIYRSEILFLCRINPQTPSRNISASEFNQLWQLTCELMQIGKSTNRIVTRQTAIRRIRSGQKVPRERFNIYKKPECPECKNPIYYWTLANRTVYACESCQPFG